MHILRIVCMVLVITGAINWGLVGFFNFDLIAFLFGEMTLLSRILYILVGLSGISLMFLAPTCYHKYSDNI